MKIGLFEIALIGGGLWLWSKSGQQPSSPSEPTAGWNTLTADLVAQAIADAKRRFPNLDPARFQLKHIEAVDWPDSSLGVKEAGKMYAQVITPGYKLFIVWQFGDFPQSFEYHADRNGRVVYAGG